MYCGSENCFICGADTVGDNTHTWCDWGAHDCPKADGLCALRDPGGTLQFRNNRWRGFDGDLTPFDHRVILPAPCCLCGEHWSMFHSEDLKWYLQSVSGPVTAVTLDGNGEPQAFMPGSEITEALYVRGDSPNYVPRGSRIIIKAELGDDSVLFTNDITVASVRVVENTGSEAQSVEDRLALDPVGMLKQAKPGVLHPLYLFSDVLVDSHLVLAMEGNMTARVWSGNNINSTLLLECGQTITNGVSVVGGQTVNFATHGQTSQVWVEFLGAGEGAIRYGFSGINGAEGINFTDTLNVTAWDVRLYTDTDNDGTIDEAVGGEREFAEYAPGRLLVMRGTNVATDVAMYPSPRAETRFSLKPDAFKQSGTLTLSAVEGNDKVEVWDAQTGGTKLTLPVTYDPPSDAPQTLWVSGVSTGTAVLAVSYDFPNSQTSSNLTAFTAIPPISVAPAVSNAYVWSSSPIELGDDDGMPFHLELARQGFNVIWRRDPDGFATDDFGTCTLANYKMMANAGAITIISHGVPGEHLAVYTPHTSAGALACTNWCAGELGNGMTVKDGSAYYYVSVDTTWLEANWKPTLDNNRAITLWSICYSADTSAGTSVKEAAGGRWRIGYDVPTCEDEARDVNEAFLRRMNGTLSNGVLRTAGKAYADPGVDYRRINIPLYGVGSVRMDGDPWTTLCPSPLVSSPVYPVSAITENRKGWGCVLLDTALDNTPPATDAVIKESGGATIFDTHWLKDSDGRFYGVGFTFDKTLDNSTTAMKAVSDKIKNQGPEGRAMDGNRVQPNADDKQWLF